MNTSAMDDAQEHGIPLPTLLKASIEAATAGAKKPGKEQVKAKRAPKPEKYTLADAFDYFNFPDEKDHDPSTSQLNNQRCILAVAFLLHYCSEIGNKKVDGFVAHGLGHALEKCASDVELAEKHREWRRQIEREASELRNSARRES